MSRALHLLSILHRAELGEGGTSCTELIWGWAIWQRGHFPSPSSKSFSTQSDQKLLRITYQKAPQISLNSVIQGKLLALCTRERCLPSSRNAQKTRVNEPFNVAHKEVGKRPTDREVTVSKIYTFSAGADRLQELCDTLKFGVN